MDYQSVITQYHEGKLNPDECVSLIQFLLDTDLINNYPELLEVGDYYVAEGLCYFVPTISS